MKDEAKEQLKQILGAYDERLAERERIDSAKRAAEAAFPARFVALMTETIRPVIHEFVETLNERGHEATIREQEESSSGLSTVSSANIALRVVPKPFAHKSKEANKAFIEITFSANRSERKIVVSTANTLINSGGSLGKRGEYEIAALTAERVAEHLLETLKEALAGAR
jgi:hypothetical protein